MCGHVGMAGQITPALEKLTSQLLIVDSLRGSHSTGVAVVTNMGTNIAKQVGNPYELFDTKAYDNAFKGLVRVVIGHNRFATQGAVNKRNAHPFDFDTLVGAHNGTLTNRVQLDGNFQVDSEQIYHHIDKFGLKDALSKMNGAWALVWYDKKDSTINFLRNKDRTLYMCYNKLGNAIFWASEDWMLDSVLWRNNVERGDIELIKEDVHLSFKIDTLTGNLEKPKAVNAPCTFVPYTHNGYFHQQLPATTNKVVDIQKKSQPTGGAKSSKRFIVGSSNRDNAGGLYFPIFDEENRTKDIRWYYYGDINPLDYVGEQIECTVSEYAMQTNGERWHRVNPNSIVLIDEDEDEDEEEVAQNNKRIHDCCWCTAPIFEGDTKGKVEGGGFGTGDYLCKDCVNDPDLKQYVNFSVEV